MKKTIIGGIITLVIGGTTYSISQSSVVNNFAKNTGMTQEQAQKYVKDSQNNLESFSKVGQEFTSDGKDILNQSKQIDCTNYTYGWVSDSLTCQDGLSQLQNIGNDEITLGSCLASLDSNLGNNSSSTISECINDIDSVDSSYKQPIAQQIINPSQTSQLENTNLYNKSVLQAALQSK